MLAFTTLKPQELMAMGAYDLLRIDPAPRGAAMGGYAVALAYHGIGSLAENPAGLADLEMNQGIFAYSDHPLDLAGGYLAYGRRMAGGYGAASLTYFDYGSFDRITTANGPVEGSFGASDALLTLGYATRILAGLNAGASVKFIRSEIENYTSTAAAVDLGLVWHTGFKMVDVAFTASNLGVQVDSYLDTGESLPLTLRFGAAKQLEHLPLQLTATAHYEPETDPYATLAGEFTVSPQLKLRAGYTSSASEYRVGGSSDGIAGLSAGCGLFAGRYRLDYTFQSQGAAGQVHRFGIGFAL